MATHEQIEEVIIALVKYRDEFEKKPEELNKILDKLRSIRRQAKEMEQELEQQNE